MLHTLVVFTSVLISLYSPSSTATANGIVEQKTAACMAGNQIVQNADTAIADIKADTEDTISDAYKLIKANSCSKDTGESFRIFVSFSMPDTVLHNLDQVARKIGAKLVIRGLKNNSFKETVSMIKSMNDRGMVIDIDPKTFHELGIHVVPAFVLSDGKKYDKIVGNLSIPYVLNKFAENGDLKEIAKKYLNRLKVKDANH